MTWDPRAERIEAQAKAATAQAEADAIRARAVREDRDAKDVRVARREDRREKRREKRQEARAKRRQALVKVLRGNAMAAAAIGSPEVIAWRGQFGFAWNTMKLGVLSPLLPVALEGGALYTAKLALDAIDADKPAGKYRAATWIQAGIAAAMNYAHGKAAGGQHGAQVGIAYALTSLLGIVMLELTVALKRHKAGKRSGEQIRQGLIRRLRYPALSTQAAAIGAARGITAEEAWQAAWVDRYGLGPDSTRRERRTARVILARQQKADRKAARSGHLAIVDGAIARPAPEPVAPTGTERQAEAFATLFGLDLSDEALAEWLDEPPAGGSLSTSQTPDIDGPHGGSQTPDELAHFSDDQDGGGGEPSDGERLKAAESRRARGERSRARVAAFMAAHPGASIKQIAEALGMSTATVKRHRRDISSED